MVWLFDYDLTLYGFDEGEVLWSLDRNITRFLEVRMGMTLAEADATRREYCSQYGTTLGGLRVLHGVQPHDYFDFIHAGEQLKKPEFSAAKIALLNSLPGERYVFTNARRDWAERGLESMGITSCFRGIFDIETFAWNSKPAPQVYAQVEALVGANGTDIIFLDDKPENLQPARELGWKTVLVHPEAATMDIPCDLKLKQLLDLDAQAISALCRG